jgi:hypothetical protein
VAQKRVVSNRSTYVDGCSDAAASEIDHMKIENMDETKCIGECMECNVEKKQRNETSFLFNENARENYSNKECFSYDEMNYSVESNSTKEYEVLMTTLKEESDDETVSIRDEDYEERHRGICESCQEIGIIGTACSKCDTHGSGHKLLQSQKDGKNISIRRTMRQT